jgi:hypothetical protein
MNRLGAADLNANDAEGLMRCRSAIPFRSSDNRFVRGLRRGALLAAVVLAATACQRSHSRINFVQINKADLVAVFKAQASPGAVSRFLDDVFVVEDFSDDRSYRTGVRGMLRLPVHHHSACAIVFGPKATPRERDDIKRMLSNSPLVYKVYENISPADIKL